MGITFNSGFRFTIIIPFRKASNEPVRVATGRANWCYFWPQNILSEGVLAFFIFVCLKIDQMKKHNKFETSYCSKMKKHIFSSIPHSNSIRTLYSKILTLRPTNT